MDRASASRRIALFLAIGTWVFLLVSLASFHVDDWPAHHVYPYGPVRNLCGNVGALIAYYCYFLLGQGIFLMLFFSGVILAMHLFRNKINDIWLRIIGLALVSIAFAATANKLCPGSENSFPEGYGGILGIAASNVLQAHMSHVGSYIVLAMAFLVGIVLCADELVVMTPQLVGSAVTKARELTPSIPTPSFSMPSFLRRDSESDAVEPAEAPQYALTTPDVKPKAQESAPNAFDGLARILTQDDEANIKPLLDAADSIPAPDNLQDPTGPKVYYPHPDAHARFVAGRSNLTAQAQLAIADAPENPSDSVTLTPQTTQIQFTYAHDDPVEPVPATADMAHVDANDPPPAVAAQIPDPTAPAASTSADQPSAAGAEASEPKAALVVRMPSAIQPRRTAPVTPPSPQELGEYALPGWNLLGDAETNFAQSQEKYVREKALVLEQALREFGIDASVVAINTGPVITMYEISMAPGTKVAQITALTNDIARALAATNVRIVAPVPGKNTVGIEVPNIEKEKVRLKELMQITSQDTQAKMAIPLFLGKDANGEALVADLASMPHCLIAGTTGSGKSVCINTIIMSVMYTQRPDNVKLVLFDPKVVEMAPFKEIPHLMCPVITETGKAASVLEWACEKMDERYEILAEAGVRNLAGYNKLPKEELFEKFCATTPEEQAKVPKHLPYIVIIIDELADLMMTAGKEVEGHIVRLAQKARAVGIHLILATQRPQATVVTGLIKANMPCKIAFRVASKMDSRIVLDQNGAELLLGQGDMLYLPGGAGKPVRSQGTYIDDREIRDSVKLVTAAAQAQFEPELVQLKGTPATTEEAMQDDMFDDAVRVVLESQRGSVSLLQRKLNIGYGRASRLIELMAGSGILGDYKGSQAREVMLTAEDWEAMKRQQQADQDSGMSV